MTTTNINVEAVKDSAANLGRIMDDMSAFNALRASFPSIGNFDLAQQLQVIIDDRRNGVVAHADQLRISLDEISAALNQIATNVENIDNGNAAAILAVVADLRTRVSEDLAGLGDPAS
ncbi:hypothetical protein [Actinophytocola oryzae]|uniref:Uncharacterized protein n=1 Tax=Actinophytocola oryzae TaxID=502181 RepID=A0A4R7V100_9PSEU|nr:hypothetical protein [Actinophytocola oryzae]TDV42167.1 hypothetical protein CLV71_11837 [Actinophytocola oryzae]